MTKKLNGQRVLCIDSANIDDIVTPITEGKSYTIRGMDSYGKGYGYLLVGISNKHLNIIGYPGKEPGYNVNRFITVQSEELKEVDQSRQLNIVQ